MSSPNVIIKHKQILSLNNVDRKNKSSTLPNYLKKYVSEMVNYYTDPAKEKLTIDDYYNNRLYNESDEANMIIGYDSKNKKVIFAKKNELENIVKQDCEYLKNSNLYQTIISFKNDFINENISIDDLHLQMVKNILPKYFESIGFDPSKISYQLSMHFNTENLHYHLTFLEKEPAYKARDKKTLQYRRKGNISTAVDNNLKKMIQLRVESGKKYNPLINEIDNELKKIKEQFRRPEQNFLLENAKLFRLDDKILKLGKKLFDERNKNPKYKNQKIAFGSIRDQEIIRLTKEIKDELFNKKPIIDKSAFNRATKNFKDYIDSLNDDLHLKNNNTDYRMIEKKEKELDDFILNQIVNTSLYEYKSSIKKINKDSSKDALLHELAYNNYKNSKYKKKSEILNEYMKNKNSYYDRYNYYNDFQAYNSCMNVKQLDYMVKQLCKSQSLEVKKLREKADINWYDKTRY